MPLVPSLGEGLLQRVKERVETEVTPGLRNQPARGFTDPDPNTASPPREAAPLITRTAASGPHDIILRVREACRHDPPLLLRATYTKKGADAPSERFLACYSVRDRAVDGMPLLYAACSIHGWAIQAFDLRRFGNVQISDKPWPFRPQYRIEFRDD